MGSLGVRAPWRCSALLSVEIVPMKAMILALLLVALVAPDLCSAESAAEALQKLEAAMQREIQQAPKAKDDEQSEPYARPRARQMMLAQVRAALGRGESGQLEEGLAQVSAYFTSDEVAKEADNLRTIVRQERETREKAILQEIDSALRHAADVVRDAKEPAQIDPVLVQLAKLRERREERWSESVRMAVNKVQPTIQFVTYWQNYLAAVKAGDISRQRDSLQNLSSSSEVAPIIPRSEILARMQKLPGPNDSQREPITAEQIENVIAKAKTLADIDPVLQELRALQAGARSSSNPQSETLNAAIYQLTSLRKTYREFEAGLPTALEMPQQEAAPPSLIPLKVQMMRLVLPRYLNLPPELKPTPGEAVQAFLERIIATAKERGDAGLILRAREAQRMLVRGTSVPNDSAGISAFTAGQNQEMAGQYLLAVLSYQNALKSGSESVPAKLIGERLNAMKEAHPKEYGEAMEQFLAPPRDYPTGPYPSGSFPPGYRPGRPDNGKSEMPALPIPGGSPMPSSSPAPPKPVASPRNPS